MKELNNWSKTPEGIWENECLKCCIMCLKYDFCDKTCFEHKYIRCQACDLNELGMEGDNS